MSGLWLVAQLVTLGIFPPNTTTPSGAPLATLPPVALTCNQPSAAALPSVVLSPSLSQVSFAVDDATNAGMMCSTPDLSTAYKALTVLPACTAAPCSVYPVFWQMNGSAWTAVTPGVQVALTAPPAKCRQMVQVFVSGRWTTEFLDQPSAFCTGAHK